MFSNLLTAALPDGIELEFVDLSSNTLNPTLPKPARLTQKVYKLAGGNELLNTKK